MKRSFPLLVLILAGVVCAVRIAIAPTAIGGRDAADALRRIREEGVIRVGYSVEPPYAFPDDTGRVTGEAPETARLVTARLGIPHIEWYYAEFGVLIDSLDANRFDVIAASMYITPERGRRVLFSEPSLRVPQGLLVYRGNPLRLHSYEDLPAKGRLTVAVIQGTVEREILRRMNVPECWLMPVPDAASGRYAVESGKADAFALNEPAITRLVAGSESGRSEQATPFRQPEGELAGKTGFGGFAFRLRDAELQAAWNREQAAVIGTPEHLAILTRFGLGPDNLPGPVTARSLLEYP